MVHSRALNYKGKEVYIGIDVHKKTYHMTALCDKNIVKRATLPAHPHDFSKSLKKWFYGAKIFSAYEAGFSAFILHRALEKLGIKNIIVNPASIETSANNKVKTDKKDSAKIAQQLSYGNLKPCRVPTYDEELKRLAHRTRQQFIKKRVLTSNQIKSKLFQFGLIDGQDDQRVSLLYLKKIETLKMPSELKSALSLLAHQWRELTKNIIQFEREIEKQNNKNTCIEILQSVPGIGPLSANIIYTELNDMSQFSNQNRLFSFIGLTPSEYSSGDSVRKGRITRQGPGRLRHILIEITWRTISKDKNLKEIYERISKRRGCKKAIVACARRLVGRMRACMINNEKYHFVTC